MMNLYKGQTGDASVEMYGWFNNIDEAISSFQSEYDEQDDSGEEFSFTDEDIQEVEYKKGLFHYSDSNTY